MGMDISAKSERRRFFWSLTALPACGGSWKSRRWFPVHYFEYSSRYVFEGERHPFWEFLYVDKGEVLVTAGKETRRLRRGDLIFHQPDEFHTVAADGVCAPNLAVTSFVCASPSMSFFENKVLRVGEVERELLSRILREARGAFSTPLDDPRHRLPHPFGNGAFWR